METEQQKGQNQTQSEEDVLNFDLDDISLEDIDQQASGNEEEVIELTDLVARGMPVEDTHGEGTGEDEIVELLKEDQVPEEEGDFKLLADDLAGLELGDEAAEEKQTSETDVADFALELDFSKEEKPKGVEEKDATELLSQSDLEDILKDEAVPETVSEQEVISEGKDLEEVVSLEDLDAAPEKNAPDQPDVISEEVLLKDIEPSPAVPDFAAEPLAAGISEEKLEAIVTRVVQEVLERVARETMASVAERVISEAIESLKKSLSENP